MVGNAVPLIFLSRRYAALLPLAFLNVSDEKVIYISFRHLVFRVKLVVKALLLYLGLVHIVFLQIRVKARVPGAYAVIIGHKAPVSLFGKVYQFAPVRFGVEIPADNKRTSGFHLSFEPVAEPFRLLQLYPVCF